MKVRDIAEWIFIADDDLDTAQKLSTEKKERTCYHCSQAIEKYLKSILVQHDILPKQFNHDLSAINKTCCNFYHELSKYKNECDTLTDYTTRVISMDDLIKNKRTSGRKIDLHDAEKLEKQVQLQN